MMMFNKEIIAFSILCVLLTAFFSYAFFKKPKLLGEDFAQLQKELMKMTKKKSKKDNVIRMNVKQDILPDIA